MGWKKHCRVHLEQVKQVMVESTREFCGSVRVGGMTPESVAWNDVAKAAVERNEAAKERCMEAYKKKREKLKYVYIRAKRK